MKIKPLDDERGFFNELARRHLPFFLQRAYPWISGGEALQWNWHLDAMCHQLERVINGECRRLLVTLPPRNLKSKTISSALPAWALGRDPTLNFVGVSYSNELSGKLGRDCLSIMQSGWYREIFPGTVISKRAASADFETTRNGGRLSTSVTGTLTGRGGDILILDDVIKPEEAYSEVTREAVNDWFKSTLSSRLNNKASGAIVVVMQRLHQFDLAGMLLEQGGWDHLCLPAIATGDETIPLTRGKFHRRKLGDVLHPEREPLDLLLELKSTMGSERFSAQYEQDPMPADGNVIKAEWLRTWPAPLDRSAPGYILQSWDTANKENISSAYSVCITAWVIGKYVYIIDVFRRRMAFPELKREAMRLALEYRARDLLIEDQASGQQLIQDLRANTTPGVPVPIPRIPEGDKVSRVHGVSAMIAGGQLLLPAEAPWLAEFKAELLGFPQTRFKDQVDALAQLLTWIRMAPSMPAASLGAPIGLDYDENDNPRWSDDEDFASDCWSSDLQDDPWGVC